MPGPAPKDAGNRRRYNQPVRGDWVDLEPLAEPVLSPAEDHWPKRVVRLWNAWREDAVTSQYGPADIAAIRDLAEHFMELPPNEQRMRMDGLGLSPKGKRDLRWRTPNEVKTLARTQGKQQVHRLRAVPK